MNSLLTNLKQYPLPYLDDFGFDEADLALFEQCMKVVSVKRKEKILVAGDNETFFRFLHEGTARQYYLLEGKEINVSFSQKDDIVCSFSAYTSGKPSEYFIEALEDSILIYFTKSDMEMLMTNGVNFSRYGAFLVAQLYRQKDRREMDLLNRSALSRLQFFFETHTELFLKLQQMHLASYLNIQPETLSTLKRKLSYSSVS